MKKFVFLAAVAAMMIAMPAQAQIKWGIKAGVNMSNFSLKDKGDNFSSSNRTGFFAGPMAEVSLPVVGMGIDGALLYDQRRVKLEEGTKEEGTKTQDEALHYISIPINVKYTYGLGDIAGVYLATGPQFSFFVGNKKKFENVTEEFDVSKSQMSWNIGVGVKAINHLQVGYNYNIGLGNTADFKVNDSAKNLVKGKLKNNTHQISVAYLF